MNRRLFLKLISSSFCLSHGSLLLAQPPQTTQQATKQLILLELKGGNDGLNTLIPYSQPLYYELRPKLAIPQNKLIKLNQHVAMHPALKPLQIYWENKQLAWIQGVGYPEQNRSHFRSIEIWDSAELDDEAAPTGWVIKSLAEMDQNLLKGIVINSQFGPLYTNSINNVLAINDLQQFLRLGKTTITFEKQKTAINPSLDHLFKLQDNVDRYAAELATKLPTLQKPAVPFPKHTFGKDLLALYKLIASGVNAPVYKVSLKGFDTHVNQPQRHTRLLEQLASSLKILQQNLESIGSWDNTLILSYSEFGRRLQENANRGTDHGAAAAHFAFGGQVQGGLYGQYPSLAETDKRGDLKYNVDFRDLYATIAQSWWNNPTLPPIKETLKFI